MSNFFSILSMAATRFNQEMIDSIWNSASSWRAHQAWCCRCRTWASCDATTPTCWTQQVRMSRAPPCTSESFDADGPYYKNVHVHVQVMSELQLNYYVHVHALTTHLNTACDCRYLKATMKKTQKYVHTVFVSACKISIHVLVSQLSWMCVTIKLEDLAEREI